MENQEAKALKGPMCDSDFLSSDILDGDSIVTCPACGRQFAVNDILHKSKEEIIEELRTNAYREVEAGKRELEYEKLQHELNKEEKEEKEQETSRFRKSGFRVILIIATIFSAILCGTAFNDGKIGAGLITILMVGLFVISFLMGSNIIPEWKKNFRIVPAIIAFLLFIPATMLYNNGNKYNREDKFEWRDIVLSTMLPEPSSNYGSILTNDSSGVYITIYNSTQEDYKNYISECKKMGFVTDVKTDDFTYEAYNSNGYKLYMYCFSGEQYTVELEAPKKRNSIKWENVEIMNKLPIPVSVVGEITNETATFFTVYVLDITKETYSQYVQECIEMGYNIDYRKGEEFFNAKNEEGYSIMVNYEGYNTMFIRIEAN